MNSYEIQDSLADLGQKWPVPSVAEAVMARIKTEPISLPAQSTAGRWRIGLLASAAAAAIALSILCVAIISTPRTLQAQVERALAQTTAAHITIWGVDTSGVREESNIWYSRGHGFRMESAEKIVVDDGRQQWTWQPTKSHKETLVVRRPSGDRQQMLAETIALRDVPADWKQHRAAEQDREIAGEKCLTYAVIRPPQQELSENGRRLVQRVDLNPPRILIWTDRQERIVQTEEQRLVQGEWQVARKMSIHYDTDVPANKFVANFPAEARIADADASLEDRFPLAKALATQESQGLLFAIHEAQRMEGGMIYVVSSVRGTPAYLEAHPPTRRRMNMTTTLLDVVNVPWTTGMIDGDWNRASLASMEDQDVRYLWWIAVPRRFYVVKDGVEVESPRKGQAVDKPRIPLVANALALKTPEGVSKHVRATIELTLTDKAMTLPEIAARAHRDISLLTARGAFGRLHGGFINNAMQSMKADQVSTSQYAEAIHSQFARVHKYDQVREVAEPPLDRANP